MSSFPSALAAGHSNGLGPVTDDELPSLRQVLAAVPDPRKPQGVRYPFTDVLLVLVTAVISGSQTLTMIAGWGSDAHLKIGFVGAHRSCVRGRCADRPIVGMGAGGGGPGEHRVWLLPPCV